MSRSSDTMEGPARGPVDEETEEALAARVGELALQKGCMVAVAESLTGGMIATALAAAEGSGDWFLGSVVAYSREVKHGVLGVPPGPVVSAESASAMAHGVRKLFGSPVAVAVTGAGGPEGQDGRDPGTVFLAFDTDDDHRVVRLQLEEAPPKQVCATTTVAALRMLVDGFGGRGVLRRRRARGQRGRRRRPTPLSYPCRASRCATSSRLPITTSSAAITMIAALTSHIVSNDECAATKPSAIGPAKPPA